MLVNNAGTADPKMTYFHEADIDALMKMVRVNLEAVTMITHAVLPLMLKRKKSSAIVNIGSGSSLLPSFPLNAVYASTKG
jgi:17beta-estradiol 17-dehydrogenase / very-long-chain 3-oxoacyl-CoA reductase